MPYNPDTIETENQPLCKVETVFWPGYVVDMLPSESVGICRTHCVLVYSVKENCGEAYAF